MAKFWSKDIRVYLGGYDISQSQVRLTVTMQSAALDPTSFPDAAERVLPGIRKDGLEWAGIFDDQATGATADMYAAATAILGTATAGTLVTVLVGTGTGSVAFVGTALLDSKQIGSSVNDLVRLGAAFNVDGSWLVAKSFGASTVMVLSDTSGSIDNAASSTAGGTLYLHVMNVGSGTQQILLRDGTDGATFVTVAGSAISTDRVASLVTYTGTIRRYIQIFQNGGTSNVQAAFRRL